ncbi:MAG TPA: hypothetical protein VMT34_11800 [Aggregatilineales bacterium]|nr:hypothetical protein [Aggregatilineales bacterium]
MPILSGQFAQIQITDYSGTTQDISTYVQGFTARRASDPADLTTFGSGGTPVTITKLRGAAVAELTLNGLFDPAFVRILRGVMAARSGCTVQARTGSNAAPVQGDEVFQGTLTLFKLTLVYNSGQVATIQALFQPTDGGAVVPGFYRI